MFQPFFTDRPIVNADDVRAADTGAADAYHAAILPEHVGIALARDMLFTGRRLTAHEAERFVQADRHVVRVGDDHERLEPHRIEAVAIGAGLG